MGLRNFSQGLGRAAEDQCEINARKAFHHKDTKITKRASLCPLWLCGEKPFRDVPRLSMPATAPQLRARGDASAGGGLRPKATRSTSPQAPPHSPAARTARSRERHRTR